jgi:polysaccharide pyruvyl transferase WcaK-like protein
LYSQVSFVFSNRLHVLLFALANGAIPFAIIDIKKNTKITGLFEDAGLKSLIININDHPIDIKALREICLDPRPIQEKIAVVQRQMKQHADQIIERIMASS